MKHCYLFLFILLLYNIPLQSIIIQNENEYLDSLIITICLGTPKQCFPFQLSTSSDDIVVFNKQLHHLKYEPTKSKTNHSTHILIGKSVNYDYITGIYMWDTFSIPNTNIEVKQVKFILCDNEIPSRNYMGILGIGSNHYTNYNKESDFLMLLKENQNIQYATISFGKEYVYIGNSPLELNELHKYKIKKVCDVNRNYGLFYCEIKNALIYNGNDVLYKEDNKIVTFNIEEYFVYVTQDFFDYLEKDLFLVAFKKKDCWESEGENYSIVIQCNKKGKEYVKNVKLIFFIEQWSEVLNFEYLFNYKEELILRKRKYADNVWVFGKIILDKYFLSFDKDNYKIIFNTQTLK